jgi:DNA-binding transcriptional regulator PaaX
LGQELQWEGFGAFDSGIYARPASTASAVPRIAAALDLENEITVVRARDDPGLGGRTLASRVTDAWDLTALARHYREFLRRYGKRDRPFPDGEQAGRPTRRMRSSSARCSSTRIVACCSAIHSCRRHSCRSTGPAQRPTRCAATSTV